MRTNAADAIEALDILLADTMKRVSALERRVREVEAQLSPPTKAAAREGM